MTANIHKQLQKMDMEGIIHHLRWIGFPRNLKVPQQEKRLKIIWISNPDEISAGRAMTQKIGSVIQSVFTIISTLSAMNNKQRG